jgi:hypothetical protein
VTLLLLVLKVALIAFVVGGTIALITRGIRRSRANRLDPRWKGHGGQPGYEASAFGAMPNTPLPEWAYWDEDDNHGKGRAR